MNLLISKPIMAKFFGILCLQALLVACSEPEPAPIAPVLIEPAVVEVVEETPPPPPPAVVEELHYYSAAGSPIRSQYYDTNIFYGELKDIPIPLGLTKHKRFSDTENVDGIIQGIEVYMGNFNLLILSERMKQNMYDHFWELQASETTEDGNNITQVYIQGGRTTIIHLNKRITDIRLDVWSNAYNADATGDSHYIAPHRSTTNPENREDILPRSN